MAKAPKDGIEDAEVVSESDGVGTSSVEARPDRDVTTPEDDAPLSEVEAGSDTAGGGSGGGMPPAVVPAPEPRRGDSVPLLMALLGGVIAAGIGWAVATYTGGGGADEFEAALAERDAEIAELRGSLERVGAIETRLDELPEPGADRGPEIDTLAERLAAIEERPNPEGPDLSPIEQALVAAAEADEVLAARVDDLAAGVPEMQAALTERVDALEARVDGVSLGSAEGGAAVEVEAVTALRDDVQALGARVDALAAEVTEGPDTAAVEEEIATLRDGLAAETEARDAAMAEMRESMDAAMEPLRADLDALAADLTAREEAIAAERARLEEEARQAAATEARRAAAASLVAAIDTGAPFEEPVAALEEQGAEVPAVLTETAAGGVPTLGALQERFPDLARETLFAAPAPEDAGAGDFLRRQLGVRSVAAREGDDPDAVLSRAEDALRQGDLEGAIAEAETLDPDTRAPLDAWLEDARLRLDAREAALSLQDS